MKRRLFSLPESIKHRFVLTREEKRVLCFVIVALLLGVTVKHYRAGSNEPERTVTRVESATPTPTPKKKPKKQRKKSATPQPSTEVRE